MLDRKIKIATSVFGKSATVMSPQNFQSLNYSKLIINGLLNPPANNKEKNI